MPGLEVRGLVKTLGNRRAVDGLTFTVDDGELFVLLGPSGCGKTTTLRIICGLEQPDEGQVLIGGRNVTSLPSRERNLGMVFQEYGLYPSMDVFGNLAYGLEARGGLRREEIERRVRETADKLELGMLLKMPVTDLSGGEQQRVALGRAMVKDADAYLFDEPLSNLDPKLRHRVRRDIVRLHRAWRRPTVYVTHDQAEAFAMGDRVAVLASGRIEQIGTPPELLDHPASTFVARFVGSPPMNLLPGRLRGEGGEYAVRVEDAVIPVPAVWRTAVASYAKENVTIGFRPDAVDVRHTNGSEGAAEAMRATVTDVEALIGETVVRLETADRSPLAVMLTDLQTEVRPGDSVDVTVDPKRLRLFDPSDDRALIS